MQEQQTSNLSIPGAIVIAGLLIGLGIYMSKATVTPLKQNNVAAVADITLKAISPTEHILGNPNAPVVIVEFSDTECPFCKSFHTTMQTIMSTYGKDGKVAWVYRHFPLDSIHPKARKEAEALECANEIGGSTLFWKYTDELYRITTSNNTLDPQKLPIIAKDVGLDVTKFNTCLSSGKYAGIVEAQYQDGLTAGAQGTPYNVLVLKTALSADVVNNLNSYIATSGLAANVWLSSDKTKIVLSGALPVDMVTKILEMILR